MIDLRAPIKVRLAGSVVPGPGRRSCPRTTRPGSRGSPTPPLAGCCSTSCCRPGTRSSTTSCPRSGRPRSSTTSPSTTRCRVVAQTLDRLKEAGFHWATRSGMTVAIGDVIIPPEKEEILAPSRDRRPSASRRRTSAATSRHAERNDDLVKIWEAATKEIEEAIPAAYPKDNPVYTLVAAGAAGNWIQVRSLAGMKGVVANSKGQQIPRPIRSSFREGLSVLEYFINTHSARKGLADTALRTAESGYLTRRLVDVSQDVIVREADCGTERGVDLPMADRYADGSAAHQRVHRDLGAGPGPRGRPGGRRRHRRRRRAGTDMREQHVQAATDAGITDRQGAFGADLRGGHRYLRDLLRPLAGHRQPRGRGRGRRHRRRAVHRRAGHAADHADLPHRCGVGVVATSPRVCPVCRSCSRPGSRRARRRSPTPSAGSGSRTWTSSSRSPSSPDDGSEEIVLRQAAEDAAARDDLGRRLRAPAGGRRSRRGRPAAAGGQPGSARGAARHGPAPGAAAPGPRGAGGVPLAGRVDPRQAHRGDHPADAAPGDDHRLRLDRVPAGRGDRAQGVRGVQPPGARRGWGAGRRPSRADGHHQGVAGHRVVALRGLLPGDHPGAHRRGDQRQVATASWGSRRT